jgi:hypothetical protein
MGVSAHPYAIIGVPIDIDRLYRWEKVKAFEHDFPEDWKVDPKTQKKLWAQKKISVLTGEEADEDDELESIGDFKLYRDGRDDETCILGRVLQRRTWLRPDRKA